MVSIPSHRVGVIGENGFVAEGYRIWRSDGTFFDVDPQDIIHWRGYNPDNHTKGISPLETLRKTLAEDAAAQGANLELMKAGLAQPGWVSRPLDAPEWSDEAQQRWREGWANQLKGGARHTPVLEEGMEFHDFGVSPKDAEMLDGRRFTVEQVASLYGVPLGLLGLGGVGGQAGLQEQHRQFYADVLPPITEMFASFLNLSILRDEFEARNLYFEFDLDEKLQGDERLKALVSAAGAPVLTRNEARAMLNKPPIDGGDEPIVPLNVVEGGKPSPAVMPPQDPNGPEQDGSARESMNGNGRTKQLEVSTLPRQIGDIRRQHRYAGEIDAVLERFYKRQRRALSSKAFESERWDKELTAELEAALVAIVGREAALYVGRLGGDDFNQARVANYLQAMAEGIAKNVNKTIERHIAETSVSEAMERALNERNVLAAGLGARATVFARKEAAKQSPTPELRLKTWVANTARHESLDGVSVPLDSDWGGIEPGSEPNCACTAVIS